MAASSTPAGYHSVTPSLIVRDAPKAIAFYQRAFGAENLGAMAGPDGRVMHAEIRIGDSIVMLSDEFPEFGVKSPRTLGGTPVTIHLYVEDVDDTFRRALDAGAKELRAVEDKFYGDRGGEFEDPFGHRWSVASHVEDVAPEEMERRMAEMAG